MQLENKRIIHIRSTVLVSLVGAIIAVGVYGSKKEEPQKEDMSAKTSVSLEDKLYRQTKIAFYSDRDGNAEIYVMNADGSEQKNLSYNPAIDLVPVWSPDGTKIAFTRNLEIYVMNADGSEQKNLTNNPGYHDQYPSWSPNGKRIRTTEKWFCARRIAELISSLSLTLRLEFGHCRTIKPLSE